MFERRRDRRATATTPPAPPRRFIGTLGGDDDGIPPSLAVEGVELSLVGDREDNQDRVAVLRDEDAMLLVAVDGMGGHLGGARAAETTVETLARVFASVRKPLLDPQGFLHLALGRAHAAVVELGAREHLDVRPRATCAVALVQDGGSWWAHVGDSRIYQLRAGHVARRTRDHSHVELLLQHGYITEAQTERHPMRNYVECCLGGDAMLPEMTLGRRQPLRPGDVLLVCTDGFWSGLRESALSALSVPDGSDRFAERVAGLAADAVRANSPHADNTSVVALRTLPA